MHIPQKIKPLSALIALYFFVLLLFGKSFTKFVVAGPLYLHDLLLLAIAVLCLLFSKKINLHFPAVLLLIILAFVYMFWSLFLLRHDTGLIAMAFRQFGLFIYLFLCYIIFCSRIDKKDNSLRAINLIRNIAGFSVILQVIYLFYGFLFIPGFSLLGQTDYNYFSPLVIMGVITYSADAVSYGKNTLLTIFKVLLGVGLSLTLGHTSAFLAVFVMVMLYAYIKIKPIQRNFSLIFILLIILSLFLLPQFTDFNVSWRLLFWKHIIERSVSDGYLIAGHGFGVSYMTHDYALYLSDALRSKIMLDEFYPQASYINPPHNSFLTIIFHVGMLPAFLFLIPLTKWFKQIFFLKFPSDRNILFLVLSVVGVLVWISFNVILELPHSAAYFWLVYFTAVYYLKNNLNP